MEEKIKQMISYVLSSLYFFNEAFNEVWCITQAPGSEEDYDIVSGPPFGFYRISLQYCLIMEYTKLLESSRPSNENQNVASLFKLNDSVYKFIGEKYNSKYLENKKLLDELCQSELYIELRALRNKKFGHADNDLINDPIKIKGFSGKQIEKMASQLQTLLRIANSLFSEVGHGHFILHNDNRTANFIWYHAIYKQFYYKNYVKTA